MRSAFATRLSVVVDTHVPRPSKLHGLLRHLRPTKLERHLMAAAPRPAVVITPVAQPVCKAGVDLVNVGVTGTERRGGLVTSLAGDDFEVYEDGKKQSIRYFAAGARTGMHSTPALPLRGCLSEAYNIWLRTE